MPAPSLGSRTGRTVAASTTERQRRGIGRSRWASATSTLSTPSTKLRRRVLQATAVVSFGLLLALLVAQAEGMWAAGGPLEGAGRLAYRVAFWITIPAEVAARQVLPPHRLTESLRPVAVGVGTALALWALVAMRRALRRRRATAAAPEVPTDPTRREVVGRLAAGTASAAIFGIGGWGSLIEPGRIRVRRYELALADLPSWAEGLRILHVTDTHYGPFVSLGYLASVVEAGNALEPDLVVLTGDYVHRSPRAIEPGIDVLCGLEGRLGRVAVLGNHDHWEGAPACRSAFRRGGITMIDNDRRFLDAGGLGSEPTAESICVAGLGDLWEDPSRPEQVLEGLPHGMPRLLLAHNPDAAEQVPPGTRVDLMLSGHTHGGQVQVPGLGTPVLPSRHGQKYASGLCQGPCCPVVVSAGVGLAILPVRLGVRPDVGLVELRSAPPAARDAEPPVPV